MYSIILYRLLKKRGRNIESEFKLYVRVEIRSFIMKFVYLNYEGKNRPCKAILPGLGKCRESLSLSKTSGQRNSADFSVVDCEVKEDLEELSEWHAPVEPVECGIGIEGIIGCEDFSDICENVGVNGESSCDLSGEGLNDERGVEVEELSE